MLYRDLVMLSFDHYTAAIASSDGAKAGIHKMEGFSIRYPGVVEIPGQVKHRKIIFLL